MEKSIDQNPDSDRKPGLLGFWALFIAQIQGAFSDSVIKFMVVFLVTASITSKVVETHSPDATTPPANLAPEIQEEIQQQRGAFITTIFVVFATPMLVFAMTAGYLADRFSKSRIVFATKAAEIVIMSCAAAALYFQSIPALIAIVFMMSMQSSFFAPPKLGMIPELLPSSKLSWANGIMGMGTFFSIIIGGLAAGILSQSLGMAQAWQAGLLLILLAAFGTVSSLFIPALPVANPNKKYQINFLGKLWSNIKLVRKDRVLALAVTGSVYFWFLAALFGEGTVLVYGQDLLQLGDAQIGLLRGSLGLGIAGGCLLAGILSGGKIEFGLIPIGSIGLTITSGLLGIPELTFVQVSVLLFLIGVSGGFFVVPINSIVQFRPDSKNKGEIIATERWLTAAGVLAATLAFYVLDTLLDLKPTQIFLTGSIATLSVTLYTFWLMPDAFVRFVLWILTHTLYRIRVVGRQHIPENGGALFVANHLSMADALFVIASTHRQIRFIMHQKMYRRWWIYPFARMLKAIPIASDMGPREMISSLNVAHQLVEDGHIVCIFAEGQIGHFGQILPFRKGMNRILKGSEAPIIPVHLDNVWGSIFSFERGKFYFKIPRKIPYPITVSYGQPLSPKTPPHEVRNAVIELGTDAWEQRKKRMPDLGQALIQTARRNRFKKALSDKTTLPISFSKALYKAILFGFQMKDEWKDQERIGLCIPPSVDATVINWAVLLAGKVPVNIDAGQTTEGLNAVLKKCGIETLIINAASRDQYSNSLDVSVLVAEELMVAEKAKGKLKAWLLASFCPKGILRNVLLQTQSKPKVDDLATITFSRGRTGEAKCIMLSHYNIVSNIQQLNQVYNFTSADSILSVISLSHAFGFLTSVAFPAVLGIRVHSHNRFDDGNAIGEIVAACGVTTLFANPDILQACIKGTRPDQFGSLSKVLVGGRRLDVQVFTDFEDRFGVKPLEGYGCAECSPVVAVNTFDFRAAGKRQVGSKRGSIGMGLPGLALKIVDPVSREELQANQKGRLLVKGPNVMMGYLDNELTRTTIQDGWFDTGDQASIDEDGFVEIEENMASEAD